MKRCPECRRDYYDDTLLYCLDDGNALLEGPGVLERPASAGGQFGDEPQTAILYSTASPGEAATRAQIHATDKTAVLPSGVADIPSVKSFDIRLLLAPIALAVIVLGGFFGYRYVTQAKQIESIAVMPFVNEGSNADIEYLSDGMTETLISSLSNLPNLNVKPRSSVFRYKGKETSPLAVGRELNVQAILNGRLVQRGQDVSLFIELIDVALDKVVWSQQYNRKQSDLATLQTDMAKDVSSKLQSKLSNADVAKVTKNSNVDAEAYQLYLKGLFQWNLRTAESLKQAEGFFRQAIAKDPNYAPAHTGLGTTLRWFPYWSLASPKLCQPQVKAAADRALGLDDSLASAHILNGYVRSDVDWDPIGAEKEFRRAIELEPNTPAPYSSLGALLAYQKRYDEAIAAQRRALDLDPLSKRGDLALMFIAARRFDEAIAEMRADAVLDPNYADTHYYLGVAYLGKGMYPEAVTTWKKYLELDNDPVGKAFLALALAKAGDREKAVKEVEQLKQDSSTRYIAGIALAICYVALGKNDEALEWMAKDVDDRSSWAPYYGVYSVFDDLKGDARYKSMMKRMNLPE